MANLPAFIQYLQDASFGGVPFYVDSSEKKNPRKTVSHSYPNTDITDTEDLGLGAVVISITGYVVGDDVYDQRAALETALNTGKADELVHPSYGSMQATVQDFSTLESVEKGSYVAFNMSFVLSPAQSTTNSPFSVDDTQSDSNDAADDLDDSANDDFFDDVGNIIAAGSSVISTASYAVQAVVTTVSGFTNQVISIANQASSVINSTIGIGYAFADAFNAGPIPFGTLTSAPDCLAALPSGLTPTATLAAAQTLLLSSAASSAQAITQAAQAASEAVSSGSSVPLTIQSLTEALRAGTASPADQIRLLSKLASYAPYAPQGTSVIGAAITAAAMATSAVARRASLSSLARAVATYQPTSLNDAQTQVAAIGPLYDAEIKYASSVRDYASAASLKKLKSSVVKDLNQRANGLANVITINVASPITVYNLAMNIYGDATRYAEILARNPQITHPLFVSGNIEILST